jgi:hypothetical protein
MISCSSSDVTKTISNTRRLPDAVLYKRQELPKLLNLACDCNSVIILQRPHKRAYANHTKLHPKFHFYLWIQYTHEAY